MMRSFTTRRAARNRFASTWFWRAVAARALLGTVVVGCVICRPLAAKDLFYETDIRPLLKIHCFHCHGEEPEARGGLDVRLVRLMVEGGDSGAAIVPGDAEASVLWQRVAADEMPEGPKKLSVDEKSRLKRWIDQGARTIRSEPDDVNAARFTEEERSHWAFQPVVGPKVPTTIDRSGSTSRIVAPIDAFIHSRLVQAQLAFSPIADRTTLIRRLSYDLTGLPPMPGEVAVFLADKRPDAYERLVDRLLASPRYGERWARHWLDVVGYAETEGGTENDIKRPHAWRYRDFVIAAFNDNMPIDQFIREQLAGDEILGRPLSQLIPDQLTEPEKRLLTATGFLRMAPDPTQAANTLAERNTAVSGTLQIVGSSLLGLTVGCAQCHDHKYDPIGTDDYYRFRAIFDPAFPMAAWQTPHERLVDVTPSDERAEAERIEANAKALQDDLNARRDAHCQIIQDAKLADVPKHVRDAVQQAVLTNAGEQTDAQRALLDQYPMVKPIPTIRGLLIEYDMPAYREFEKEEAEIAALRATKPPARMIRVAAERPEVIPTSAILFRGDPETPGAAVEPGELTVLKQIDAEPLAANDPTIPTTGRRLAYARLLTNGHHPLTARVFVNRVWMHHFGRGLVNTPGDFGLMGDAPTHPELLDWLAADFVQHGWDLKRLHRQIVLSITYRQSARRTSEHDAIDPENQLYARMNVRRLEAEAVRDAMLHVSDSLSLELEGPSTPVTEDGEGKVVLGQTRRRDGLAVGVDPPDASAARRSIYVEVNRKLPLEMLATFDQPVMTPNCDRRRSTTVAGQSLWFLNDSFSLEQSERMAAVVIAHVGDSPQNQIGDLFQRLFATGPTQQELAACLAFLDQQRQHYAAWADPAWQEACQKDPAIVDRRVFATLCQTLMASNRFLYVD